MTKKGAENVEKRISSGLAPGIQMQCALFGGRSWTLPNVVSIFFPKKTRL
jgi:hypothetical protein